LGEQLQLQATATAADGTTSDCTPSATWTSSDAAIARFSASVPGQLVAVKSGSVTLTASCATGTATLAAVVGGGVRIVGLEAFPQFITADTHLGVRAVAVSADGAAEADCSAAATWTSSNPAVASIGSQLVARDLTAGVDGTATISATCGSTTGQIDVRVGHYQLSGVVRDAAGAPVAGADVTMYRDFGFDNTETTHTVSGPDGRFAFSSIGLQVRVTAEKAGFRRQEVFLNWDRTATMSTSFSLVPTSGH
jgi:hypothetical protein